MFPHKIEGNLEMRPAEIRFASELYELVVRNKNHLYKWMPWVTHNHSLDDTRNFLKFSMQNFAENKTRDFLIFSEKAIVGTISFNSLDFVNKSTEIGYWLDNDSTGKGIISKCCFEMLKLGFDDLKLNRIVIRCGIDNIKSQGIPERLGFKKEGILREAQWLHDKFVDLVVYSLLKSEWKNN